jgi:hypothetical protein
MTSEAIFSVSTTQLLLEVRDYGHDIASSTGETLDVLTVAGLVDGGQLTPAGDELYRTAWVFKDEPAAKKMLGQAMRSTLPVQVMDQELRNFPAISDEGVLNLLKRHGVVSPHFTIENARRGFRVLNECGVIAFSTKVKTVRFIPDDADAAKAGETPDLAAMISPRTPFSNLARLRRVLRTLEGEVTWADPHFSVKAFEELVDELDPTRVKSFRIISGRQADLTPKSFSDYERFRKELAAKGITVEWRVDENQRDWHDRWLVHSGGSLNMPPINTLFKGDYSEIYPSAQLPPVQEWWDRSTPRTQ